MAVGIPMKVKAVIIQKHAFAAFVNKTAVHTYHDNANWIKHGLVMLYIKTFKSIWKCIWLEQFFKPVYVSCRQYGEGQRGWGPWVCGTVMMNRRGSNIPLPLRLNSLTHPRFSLPDPLSYHLTWLPTLPNWPEPPAHLTWTPCPSDLEPLPIWPHPFFITIPPYPTPPLPFPKMVSETNFEGLKNCFNQIHFQINFMSSSMTFKSHIWWSLHNQIMYLPLFW